MKKIQFLAAAVIVAACSSEPMITDRDVLVHQNRGELYQLYERLNTELAEAKPSSELADNRRTYIAKVGRKIAEDKERIILNRLERDLDKHTIAVLQAEQENAAGIETYNREVYLELNSRLQESINKKQTAVNELQHEFDMLEDDKAPEKVALLEQMAEIQGGEMADKTGQRRDDYISGLYEKAEQALSGKRYEDVRMHLANLQTIQPDYPGLQQLRHQLIAAEYEQAFWDALSRGQTDKAFETYKELSQIPDYLEKNPDVVPSVEDMARYFIAEGNRRMGSYAVASAYQSYSRARYVKNTLGQQDDYTEGELKFIDFVDRRLQGYIEKDQTIPAYGFLQVLQELEPDHESVQQYAQSVNNRMLDDATGKIVPSVFTGMESGQALGKGIVSRINQHLLDDPAVRVKVIENGINGLQLSREQIGDMPNASSYYFLSGEILNASVERREQQTDESKRVLVSYKRIENPDYIAWTEMSKRDRKNTPEPESTIQVPVEEDVTIQKTLVQKDGSFSVTYRLAEAVSANVLFSDAISETLSHTDESIQGIERGLFSQEAKTADLPSDGEILEQLSKQVAEQASAKLAEQIQQLESRYRKQGDQALVAEDFNKAVANFAYANVLLQAEGEQDEDLLNKLRSYAIRWKSDEE